MIVQLAGLPGTGKTALARAMAAHLKPVLLLDKDIVRHTLFGPDHTLFTREQDDFCAEVMLRATGWQLDRSPSTVVILDGRTCSQAYQVTAIRTFAQRTAHTLRLIECVCPESMARARLARDCAQGQHLAANRNPDLHQRLTAHADPIPEPKLVIDTSAPLTKCLHTALAYVTVPSAPADPAASASRVEPSRW